MLEVGGAGSATFADGLSVTGGSVVVEGSERIVGGAASVDVTGSESVRVGSTGSLIELTGTGKIQYTQFVWRSSAAFDEYENAVPLITDVEEVIIRSRLQGGALTAGDGETYVYMDLLGSDGGTEWTRVWGSNIGMGTFSLDGLHVRFDRQDVIAVRLGSSPHNNPSFVGWSECVFHFGAVVDAGNVAISAAGMLDAVSGEDVSLSADAMTLTTSGRVDVQGLSLIHI